MKNKNITETRTKVYYTEIYPVVRKKVFLGLFKIREVLREKSLGTGLEIISNRQIDEIYFNGKRIYEKKRINQVN